MRALVASPERQTTLLIVVGTLLVPLQIWPPMPLPGMQLSDVAFLLAFVQFLVTRRESPPASVALAITAFAVGAAASALFGGSAVKLLGHFMLAAVGWMAACASPVGAFSLRRALVGAGAVAAVAAATGAAAFYAGFDTPLLNIYGDLVPGDYPRVRGTMVRAHMMASVVGTGLVLLWFERGLARPRWLRWMIFALGAVALLFSLSRTIAAVAVVVAGAELWRRRGPLWLWLFWGVGALATAAALWISIRYYVVLNPTEPWAVEVLPSDGTRFAIWRKAVVTLAQHPVLGVGPGIPVAEGWWAHNTWLNLWAGIGVTPMLAFAVLMITALVRGAAAHQLGVAAALAVFLIESTYIDVEDMRHVWLLLGIALSAGLAGSGRPLSPGVSTGAPGP